MSTKLLYRSFAGGEITTELAGRSDLVKYQTGLSLCRNFITLPHGPAARRPGFEFVAEARDSTHPVRLMPFSFSSTQTVVLEFGHLYIRFISDGAHIVEGTVNITSIAGSTVNTSGAHGYTTGDWVYIGGRYHKIAVVDTDTYTTADLWGNPTTATGTACARVYTLASPYDSADVHDLHFAQSSDVVTITHPSYPSQELRRYGAYSWGMVAAAFAPPTNAPTGVTATATVAVATNLTEQKYVATAVQPDGVTESLASDVATCTNNLTLAGNYNTITLTGVNSATRYHVYKLRGGTYGYVGKVTITPVSPVNIDTIFRWSTQFFSTKTVNVQTAAAHSLIVGDYVQIKGTGYATLDGCWRVATVPTATTFTYLSTSLSYAYSTVGTSAEVNLSLVDDNILPDTSRTPPEDIIALNAEPGDYPTAVCYYEQRRWFGGATYKPQTLWATRTGTESNLTSSIPAQDGDGMELRVAAMQNNKVLHLVALSDLLALTTGGEFRVGSGDGPITPGTVSIKPQGYSGASNVQPVVTSGSILYVQAQGSRVRELGYNWESNSYRTLDVSIMAPHRFNGHTIRQIAYSRAPDQIMWAVRDDGLLLGLTYVPDQQVFGWHAHDTDGFVESVCTIAEDNEDALYVVVRREVAGRSVRYVERLRSRVFVDQEDAFFVDSGLSYSGTPVTTLSGLWHLEGRTVDILADGAVHPRKVVTGGAVSLDYAASVIHVGLPYTSDLRTLPLVIEGSPAAGQGTIKNISRAHIRVTQSSIVQAGPSFDRLREYPARSVSDPYGSPPALQDGELSISVDPSWNNDAALCVRQDGPLPLTVLSMTLEIQTGG